jgi:hypothetical protein
MRRIVKWIGLIVVVLVVLVTAIKLIDYNSLVSQNTRQIEERLSQNAEDGNVRDLISFSYDKVYVFKPYQSLDQMEEQIGFKYSELREGLSEGITNILFVKNSKAVAYLYGYSTNIGFDINLPSGEYTKAQIDNMLYKVEKREIGNSYGTSKTYMYYELVQD